MYIEDKYDVAKVVKLFQSEDRPGQQFFLDYQCPPLMGPNKAELTELLISLQGSPAWGITALSVFAQDYAHTGRYELGAILGEACYRLAKNALENIDLSLLNQYLFSGGQGALSNAIALQQMSRNEEALSLAKETIPWLESMGDTTTLPSLKLHKIEANLDLERIEEAKNLLNQIEVESLSSVDRMTFKRLERKLIEKIDPIIILPVEQKTEHQKVEDALDYILNSIRSLEVEPEAEQDLNQLEALLKQIKDQVKDQKQLKYTDFEIASRQATNVLHDIISGRLGATVKVIIQQVKDTFTKLLQPSPIPDPAPFEAGQLNEWEVMRQLEYANSTLLDAIKQIERSLTIYQQIREWTKENKLVDHENDALWGCYLCYNRLDRSLEALQTLQALRTNIETIRKDIADPYKKAHLIEKYPAGILTAYPYLFSALCVQLYKLHRPMELLDAIEGAKGRVLADILTEKLSQQTSDNFFSEAVQQLPALMQEAKAHYLSYFVDDEATYAVLVAKDGSLHTQEIPIGKKQIKEWLDYKNNKKTDEINGAHDPLHPKNWGNIISARAKVRVINLSENLAPLVKWLQPLAESGIIQINDHICYCPDGELHLIPLHYLPFGEQYLVNYVSMSRVQSAMTLVNILKRKPLKLEQFTAVQVWAESDVKEPYFEKMKAGFELPGQWLKEELTGKILSEINADLATVTQLDFSNKIVHFATHGVFPSLIEQGQTPKNPYLSSGLLLAQKGKLPLNSEEITENADLSPKQVIEQKLNFWGSHVTLQACVSGRAKEGIGGDALGLEWAFLLNGASSLLASHWNVEATWAAKFSIKFYQKWLVEKASRAVAWRETVLELIRESHDLERTHPEHTAYYWAPFSLSGDWR
ncbi:CHAT domain-containing protein [Aerosakkonemataceae cyanobacterium BLCC-F154]|uniref:CHAT domain-containing protein n=1 Tax=Floridaenema fluviatile BLCC-F154 TaxID=3153640 RepID=A0ABV4YAM3_9CYAN